MMRLSPVALVTATLVASAHGATAQPTFRPADPSSNYWMPGDLKPGSGDGYPGAYKVEVEGMRFPIQCKPAFANTQVYAHGGGEGPKPLTWNQKHPSNFQYPWRDNFCEKRGKLSQKEELCPQKAGVHQGQDIRAASHKRNKHWAVATVSGKISKNNLLGSSSTLDVASADQSRFFRYLHLFDDAQGESLPPGVSLPTRPKLHQSVARGDRVGLVSAIMRYKDKDGAKVKYGTTTHLHFEIWEASPQGYTRVPPYSTLVESYGRLLISAPPPGCGS